MSNNDTIVKWKHIFTKRYPDLTDYQIIQIGKILEASMDFKYKSPIQDTNSWLLSYQNIFKVMSERLRAQLESITCGPEILKILAELCIEGVSIQHTTNGYNVLDVYVDYTNCIEDLPHDTILKNIWVKIIECVKSAITTKYCLNENIKINKIYIGEINDKIINVHINFESEIDDEDEYDFQSKLEE